MPRLPKHIEDELLSENPKLCAAGLRPEIVWVYDTKSGEFKEALRRQIEAIRQIRNDDEAFG